MNESIPLSQKLYLLAIHPEKGGIISTSYSAINYVLIGSLLLELYQNKNIRFEDKRIIVLNTKSNIEIHRFLLEKLSATSKQFRISRWISKLNMSAKHIRQSVQHNLTDKRYIRMQDKKFLFFKWKTPVLLKKQYVFQLITEIDKQIFSGTATEDEIILLSFIKPAGLLRRIFPERDKRKRGSKKLNKMMVENQVSIAVADAISAAQAVAASVAATSAATAASG